MLKPPYIIVGQLAHPTCGDPACDIAENPEHWVSAELTPEALQVLSSHAPIDEAEEAHRGELIAEVLYLKKGRGTPGQDHYATEWGSKTAVGLYRTIKRIVEEGK